ncbi:GDSL family lipase [Oscillatoriales cyanobacterium USR001]|nr:GDSL family lipase [Oscillatoriales cyanobacterium USR001]
MIEFEVGSGGSSNKSRFGMQITGLNNPPAWALLSLVANGLLLVSVAFLVMGDRDLHHSSQVSSLMSSNNIDAKIPPNQPILGPRHKWTYQQWVTQLGREAEAAAANKPEKLTILAGDSLTMWFPPQLLPPTQTWLNQGISGETSTGLLKRLQIFDRVEAETIFLMIGINDLIRGVGEETILANHRQMIRDLRWLHPHTKIVVQSILPHGGKQASWEGRDRLLAIPNSQIRELNQRLKEIASSENVLYLDLYPLFTDAGGNLRRELSTDGLHLNDQGYLVWRSALLMFSQLELDVNR